MSRPGHRSAARFVVLVVLIDAIGLGIIMPVLPQIVMTLGHVGLSEATRIGGWLGIVYAAVQFVTGPLIGNLADRFGRRPVLLGSLGGFAVDYALMGFAPSLGWLFLGRVLAGLFGASYGAAGAAMADISAPEDRARPFRDDRRGVRHRLRRPARRDRRPARRDRHARAVPRRRLAGRGQRAVRADRLSRDAGAGQAAAVRLDARQPARRVACRCAGGRGLLPLSLANFWWALAMMIYPTTWAFYAIAAFGWSPGRIGASLALVGALMALNQIFLSGGWWRASASGGRRRSASRGECSASSPSPSSASIG